MGKKAIKTKKEEIVAYWVKYQDECGLSVDWSEADCRCWRCGYEASLQRCHIIPASLGGADEPGNLVLLCARCHAKGPNVVDPEIMWDWIRAYGTPFYDTFWLNAAQKEYEFIYKHSVLEDMDFIIGKAPIKAEKEEVGMILRDAFKMCADEVSTHFGQNYWNTATLAGIFRMKMKSFAKRLGLNSDILKEDREGYEYSYWWADASILNTKREAVNSDI